MKAHNYKQARKLQSTSQRDFNEEKNQLVERQRLELLTFRKMWEDRMDEYERQARELILHTKRRQNDEFRQEEANCRQELLQRRPHDSRAVIAMREMLDKLVRQRKYLEAEELKHKLEAAQHDDIGAPAPLSSGPPHGTQPSYGAPFYVLRRLYYTLLTDKFDECPLGPPAYPVYSNEIQAIKQRLKLGNDELLAQRKSDFERLVQHHTNEAQMYNQKARLGISKTQCHPFPRPSMCRAALLFRQPNTSALHQPIPLNAEVRPTSASATVRTPVSTRRGTRASQRLSTPASTYSGIRRDAPTPFQLQLASA
eukprot:gene4858-5008_t